MPLDATRMVQDGPLLHQDILQFVNLLTGTMNDQPVTIANTLQATNLLVMGTSQMRGTLTITFGGADVTGRLTARGDVFAGGWINSTDTVGGMQFAVGGTTMWIIQPTTGVFYPNADNAYDIGIPMGGTPPMAFRPRNVYAAGAFIGNGAVPPGGAAGQVLTKASANNYDLAWGVGGGGGLTWPLLAPDGSAAAPSYSFANQPGQGIYSNGVSMGFSTGGVFRAFLGASLALNVPIQFSVDNTVDIGAPSSARPRDLFVARDIHVARNLLGNWENSVVPANNAWIISDLANSVTFLTVVPTGTATQTGVMLMPNSTATNTFYGVVRVFASGMFVGTTGTGGSTIQPLNFGVNGTFNWVINTSGHFVAGTDNSWDIGQQGATRPRDLWVARFGGINQSLGVGPGTGGNISAVITLSGQALTGSPQWLLQLNTFMGTMAANQVLGGMYVFARPNSSGTISAQYGVWVDNAGNPFNAAIANNYGVRIGNQGTTGVVNAYGLWIDGQSNASSQNVSLAVNGTNCAHFNGLVIIDTGFGFGWDASKGLVTAFGFSSVASADVAGWYSRIAGGKNQTSSVYAVFTQANLDGTGAPYTANWVGGMYVASLYGYANNAPNGVTISNMVGIRIGNQSGGTGGGGQMTNSYGLYVDGQGQPGTTNAYGIWVGTVAGATGDNFGIVVGNSSQRIRNPVNNQNSLSIESANGYVFISSVSGSHLAGNAYYDGIAWQRISVGNPASVWIASGGAITYMTTPAGSNPATFNTVLTIDNNGAMNMMYASGGPANPTIQLANAAFINGKDSNQASRPILCYTGDNYMALYCGVSGLLFTNYANSARLATMDNSGNLNLSSGALTVAGGIRMPTNGTIQLTSDGIVTITNDGQNMFLRTGTIGALYVMHNDQQTYSTVIAAAFSVGSARRFKTDIVVLDDPLSYVMDDRVHAVRYTEIASARPKVGFIAEDWAAVEPTVVAFDDSDAVEALDYDRISAITFEALKQHVIKTNARLDALERKLAA